MWRSLIAFFAHRIVLFGVILLALNQSETGNGNLPRFRLASFSTLKEKFEQKILDTDEAKFLSSIPSNSVGVIFQSTKNPMYLVSHAIRVFTGWSVAWVLVLVSSLFFLFFLSELNALVSRMQTSDIAAATVDLALLWPTSYELNLGSTFALVCFLATFAVRKAHDDRWIECGVGMALLALAEPSVLLLLPIGLYFFWYYQRLYLLPQRLTRGAFFLLPLSAVLVWRYTTESGLNEIFSGSALLNLFGGMKGGQSLQWTMGQTVVGQTLTLIIFLAGAIVAAVTNQGVVHKVMALGMVVVWLATSPYESLASRCLLAGLALQGVASAWARPMLHAVKLGFFALGAYEAFVVMRM